MPAVPPGPGRVPVRERGRAARERRRHHPAGPLVARVDAPPVRPSPVEPPESGRLRRFVRRHGWRAYAVPVLALLTLAALLDLALRSPEPSAPATSDAAAPTSPAATPSVADPPPTTGGTATAPFDVDLPPSQPPVETGPTAYTEKGAGTVTVVDGTSAVHGTGPLQRFVVEVEDGIGVDAAAFAGAVEATLADPRSWGGGGRMSFQRVGAAEAAAGRYAFRVTLISPGSMEIYCPGVGTGGYTSCRYGERAVINLARWATAVPHYDGDVATYRHYVVNHEVGHALGNGHQNCPGRGRLAPVMQQQTLGLEGCTRNAWPYP